MATATKQIVIILLLLNAAAGMVNVTGVGDALNINPELGADDKVDAINETSRNVQSTQSNVATLFGLISGAVSTMTTVVKLFFYGPAMLISLGVPEGIMGLAGGASAVIIIADIIYLKTGRQL